MSVVLDALLALAADETEKTVILSPEGVAVLLYASRWLEMRESFIDKEQDPVDDISQSEWDQIEAMVAGVYYAIMNPQIGVLFPFVTANPPDNCLECDGSVYNRVDYPSLYGVLDEAFIIDEDTFFVPDLTGRTVIGAGAGSGLTVRLVNSSGGEEQHQLTGSEMPSHNHTIGIPDFSVPVAAPGEVFVPAIDFLPSFTGSSGGDAPHNNMQPFCALRYAVRAN